MGRRCAFYPGCFLLSLFYQWLRRAAHQPFSSCWSKTAKPYSRMTERTSSARSVMMPEMMRSPPGFRQRTKRGGHPDQDVGDNVRED